MLEEIDYGPHPAHDCKTLKRLPSQKAVLTEDLLPLDQRSVTQLPFPATSYYKTSMTLMQRGHFKGLTDNDVLKSLYPRAKAEINRLQRQYAWEVADFDLL